MPKKNRKIATTWVVKWRNKITRDIGIDIVVAESEAEAREYWTKTMPMREITDIKINSD